MIKTIPVEAMPQRIAVLFPTDATVKEIRQFAQTAYDHREVRKSQCVSVTLPGATHASLWHAKRSRTTGVYFAVGANEKVDFVYDYKSLRVLGKQHAAEALAFRWDDPSRPGPGGNRGFTRPVYFDLMLPRFGFVVTDSMYTADGERWLLAQYAEAFRSPNKYAVYLVDTKLGSVTPIQSWEEFSSRYASWWGFTEDFRQFRFAIELKSYS